MVLEIEGSGGPRIDVERDAQVSPLGKEDVFVTPHDLLTQKAQAIQKLSMLYRSSGFHPSEARREQIRSEIQVTLRTLKIEEDQFPTMEEQFRRVVKERDFETRLQYTLLPNSSRKLKNRILSIAKTLTKVFKH
jgi:hypothetical protein